MPLSLSDPSMLPISIKGVALDSADKMLLLKNERDEWELPGGRIKIGETPEECVAREIFEETQWKVRIGPILDTWMHHINEAEKHVFIVTYGCFPETDIEPVLSNEHKEIGLFSASEVDGLNIPDGYRRSIATWLRSSARTAHPLRAVTAKPPGPADPRRRPSALWLWSSTEASRALRSRDLAVILRTYRRLNRLSQEQLALLLGYDKTYISMIETRRRVIGDVATLRHVAHRLGIPVHVLGVTEEDDATFAAMMQFADSVLRLAEIALQAGLTADAINELWPLVARLEARAADGFVDRTSLALLGKARASLGIALGTLLPEERLATAAKWTGQALVIAKRLDEPELLAYALAVHGNELRKAGRIGAAIERLRRSIALYTDPAARAMVLAFLARAAGEARHAELFDTTMTSYRHQLEEVEDTGMLGNRFTFHEVLLRGLVATGRARQAATLIDNLPRATPPVARQWTVIERVTAGEVLLANGDRDGAEEALRTALDGADRYRLPHQAQRAVRVASGTVEDVADAGRAVLVRLDSRLSVPDS